MPGSTPFSKLAMNLHRAILITMTLFLLAVAPARSQCSTSSYWVGAPVLSGTMNATGVVPGNDTVQVRHTGSYSAGRPIWSTGSYTYNGKNFSSLQISRGSSFGSGNRTSFKLAVPLDSTHVHIRVWDIRGDLFNAESQRVQGWLNGVAVAATFTDPVNGAFISGGNVINGASTTTSTTQSAMRAHFNSAVDSITVTATNLSDFVVIELMVACDLLLPAPGGLLKGQAVAEGNQLWCTDTMPFNGTRTLQRSRDGRSWMDLHVFTPGETLRFVDQAPEPGRDFYRLRIVGYDGWPSYSNQVSLGSSLSEARWAVFPNPCKEYLNLSGPDAPILVLCLAADGSELRRWQSTRTDTILDTRGLPFGILFLRTQYRDGSIGTMRILHL